jgi:acyl-CoA thioesterase-1
LNRRSAIITLISFIGICTLHAEEEKKTLLVLGDSLTKGYGVLEAEAFPALLGDRLGWNVVNGGVSGDTSAGGLRRLSWLLKSKPDLLIVALGGNDGLRGIDPASTEENLRAIIDKARASNPKLKILLTGIDVPKNMGEKYVARFKEIFPKIAKEKRVPLVPDLLEGVGGVAELNQEDRIHPNAVGHKKIADLVWKHLAPLPASDTIKGR